VIGSVPEVIGQPEFRIAGEQSQNSRTEELPRPNLNNSKATEQEKWLY
jgi:hypothetical protein